MSTVRPAVSESNAIRPGLPGKAARPGAATIKDAPKPATRTIDHSDANLILKAQPFRHEHNAVPAAVLSPRVWTVNSSAGWQCWSSTNAGLRREAPYDRPG
jgi:hypothetical protein